MGGHKHLLQQTVRMLAAVMLCYAIVLQAVFGSLSYGASPDEDETAFVIVLCHTGPSQDSSTNDPSKDVHARHHCILCQCGGVAVAAQNLSPAASMEVVHRKATVIAYLRRQDPSTAPLYLPPRVSRGPPRAA